MKKRLLIYAHYYAPDVASTGQILQNLAEGMADEFDVTVICTVPSYTGKIAEGYEEKRFYREELNGVHILRVPVPEFTKSSKKSRIKNILAYYYRARKATDMVGAQDYIFTIIRICIINFSNKISKELLFTSYYSTFEYTIITTTNFFFLIIS